MLIGLASLFYCCASVRPGDYSYRVVITKAGNEDERQELERQLLKRLRSDSNSSNIIEIIICNISSVKEVFYYTDGNANDIKTNYMEGTIEALVKVKINYRLYNVYSIEAEGNNREEMIRNLSEKINEKIFH